jgi:hypothetical protein
MSQMSSRQSASIFLISSPQRASDQIGRANARMQTSATRSPASRASAASALRSFSRADCARSSMLVFHAASAMSRSFSAAVARATRIQLSSDAVAASRSLVSRSTSAFDCSNCNRSAATTSGRSHLDSRPRSTAMLLYCVTISTFSASRSSAMRLHSASQKARTRSTSPSNSATRARSVVISLSIEATSAPVEIVTGSMIVVGFEAFVILHLPFPRMLLSERHPALRSDAAVVLVPAMIRLPVAMRLRSP